MKHKRIFTISIPLIDFTLDSRKELINILKRQGLKVWLKKQKDLPKPDKEFVCFKIDSPHVAVQNFTINNLSNDN